MLPSDICMLLFVTRYKSKSLVVYSISRFTDLDKLKLVLDWFRLEQLSVTGTTASINKACFKSGQNRLKNNRLAVLP